MCTLWHVPVDFKLLFNSNSFSLIWHFLKFINFQTFAVFSIWFCICKWMPKKWYYSNELLILESKKILIQINKKTRRWYFFSVLMIVLAHSWIQHLRQKRSSSMKKKSRIIFKFRKVRMDNLNEYLSSSTLIWANEYQRLE